MNSKKDITVDLKPWFNKDEYLKEVATAFEIGCERLEKEYMELLDTKGKAISDLGYSIEITYRLDYNSVGIFSFLNRDITYQMIKDRSKKPINAS